MPEAKQEVVLLESTPRALNIIHAACRQCYSARFAGDLINDRPTGTNSRADFVRMIVASGHESPLEHVTFTFAIQGVSRALTHQLVRHRMASYSQQSQRYVSGAAFGYIMPPSVRADGALRKEFSRTMRSIQKSYNAMIARFREKGITGERATQDARFVLPQATETKIVVTMNCRELMHFFKQRCCARAQWEIKALAGRMLAICKKKLPEVFFGSGAKCEWLKYCPEDPRFSCGRYPALKRSR